MTEREPVTIALQHTDPVQRKAFLELQLMHKQAEAVLSAKP